MGKQKRARIEMKRAPSKKELAEIRSWCGQVTAEVAALKWDVIPCDVRWWRVGGYSVEGRPLIYADFGNADAPNVTVVYSMVHPDEMTPLYLALKLAEWLAENIDEVKTSRVVIAPLVNPDGFFVKPRTRVNARGVDLNRNFHTQDWLEKALTLWTKRFRSNPRRFPGHTPDSEPETIFQRELIFAIKPQKILSIHAPLNFMDYDGPDRLSLSRFPKDYVSKCLKLRTRVKAVPSGFFPGSLGNYAGQERGIPTLTLELPSADSRKARSYWHQFRDGIHTVIRFQVPQYAFNRQVPRPQ